MTQAPQTPPPPVSPPPAAPAGRPGGLTALAVLNFVFAGLGIIGIFAVLALITAAKSFIETTMEGAGIQATNQPSVGMLYVSLLLGLVVCALLIVSGVGYIQQKKSIGFMGGNIYAIVAILSAVIGMINQGFGFMSLIGLAYPIVTLALLNTTFKNAFIR